MVALVVFLSLSVERLSHIANSISEWILQALLSLIISVQLLNLLPPFKPWYSGLVKIDQCLSAGAGRFSR